MTEARITINGKELTPIQSTIIRLALTSFSFFLLRDRTHAMTKYLSDTNELIVMIDNTAQERLQMPRR